MKPRAPVNVRGEFKPIATAVPGLQICEHMPKLAKLAQQFAIVRSVSHKHANHTAGAYLALTGHEPPETVAVNEFKAVDAAQTPPAIGSILAKLRPETGDIPPYIVAPNLNLIVVGTTPGQRGGWLGPGFDPFVANYSEVSKDFEPAGMKPVRGVDAARLQARQELRNRFASSGEASSALPGSSAAQKFDSHYEQAFAILSSTKLRQTLSVQEEPARMRELYGSQCIGQSYLLARRLVEAGARLVLINDGDKFGTGRLRWDTHGGNFTTLRKNLPETDHALTALLQDLKERGLLETTLVVWMGEYGRTPQVDAREGAGRGHWSQCYSVLLAGCGIQGGQVYGSSDPHGAYPRTHPCRPENIHATIYHALGIPENTALNDTQGRPLPLYQGAPISQLFS
jgi:hypothetical protein